MTELWRRICFLFRRRRFDRDLTEEMRQHLDMKARKLIESASSRRNALPGTAGVREYAAAAGK